DDWSANKAAIQASGKTKRVPSQRQPKLRQDPERCVYVREGLARGRFPRTQAPEGRSDLTSAPASEYSSVMTVPSRHRHRSSDDRRRKYTRRGAHSRGARNPQTDEDAQPSPALARAGTPAGRDRLAHAMLAPPRTAAIKVMHKGG